MAKRNQQFRYILSFSQEEISNARVKTIIISLIELKLSMQKYRDFLTISPAEFEVLSKFGDFVPKEKYKSKITFKGEVGKIKGRRVVVLSEDN